MNSVKTRIFNFLEEPSDVGTYRLTLAFKYPKIQEPLQSGKEISSGSSTKKSLQF